MDDELFALFPEELLRVVKEVAIERVFIRHEYDERGIVPPTGAPGLLPGREETTGKTDQDDRVEASNIDPRFERARRDDPVDPPLPQSRFDLTPLLR